eukprot:COSAG03_NODE_18399_length_356_cov_0.529183_1_plen_41_part_10
MSSCRGRLSSCSVKCWNKGGCLDLRTAAPHTRQPPAWQQQR